MLTSVYQNPTLIIYSLVTEYFRYNNIELSERSFDEVLSNSNVTQFGINGGYNYRGY